MAGADPRPHLRRDPTHLVSRWLHRLGRHRFVSPRVSSYFDAGDLKYSCSIYTFFAAAIVVVWPVWEARGSLAGVARGIFNDIAGRGLVKV